MNYSFNHKTPNDNDLESIGREVKLCKIKVYYKNAKCVMHVICV